ncbi:hypothetical protein F5148DRAFT_753867 [Russula earlei]|uniref:Uncharacterized protein n=1 Tax=Russula earlei TaxID=71964 RepID=A0ACC0UF32_9AGAM|nr:hypothetical protein F5148DRAFT_753867 [Russula earlei]
MHWSSHGAETKICCTTSSSTVMKESDATATYRTQRSIVRAAGRLGQDLVSRKNPATPELLVDSTPILPCGITESEGIAHGGDIRFDFLHSRPLTQGIIDTLPALLRPTFPPAIPSPLAIDIRYCKVCMCSVSSRPRNHVPRDIGVSVRVRLSFPFVSFSLYHLPVARPRPLASNSPCHDPHAPLLDHHHHHFAVVCKYSLPSARLASPCSPRRSLKSCGGGYHWLGIIPS